MNKKPDFSTGLLPAIVQDFYTGKVLMQGFMNAEAFEKTLETGHVTFWSRSKERLWMKGESSGNVLELIEYAIDCDGDSILLQVRPHGPTCHTGSDTCWDQQNKGKVLFIQQLAEIIKDRKNGNAANSYTKSLFEKGINKVAQKVGEEAVELVIEAKDNNKDLFLNEAADLLFHYLVLLEAKEASLDEVLDILIERHGKLSR